MLKFWRDVALMSFEAQQVIALRMLRLGRGGKQARSEASRMVAEKVSEGFGIAAAALSGGSPEKAMKKVRRRVRANARRLSRG